MNTLSFHSPFILVFDVKIVFCSYDLLDSTKRFCHQFYDFFKDKLSNKKCSINLWKIKEVMCQSSCANVPIFCHKLPRKKVIIYFKNDSCQTANLFNSEILESDNDNAKKKKRKRQKQINDDDELPAEKYYFYDHLLK